MAFQANDAVVFVPGLMGFGRFGSDEAPLIRYFDHVANALGSSLGVADFERRCLFHEPPPTGPLALRVDSLARAVDQLLTVGLAQGGPPVSRVHIIGHSTGGLDARLLVNRAYGLLGGPTASDKRALLGRIATVVSVSAPLRGAPFAKRVAKSVEGIIEGPLAGLIPFLFLFSILNAARDKLRLSLPRLLAGATLAPIVQMESLLGFVSKIDRSTARQITNFIGMVKTDHRLFQNLEPESMSELNARIDGSDTVAVQSFATVSPPPPIFALAPTRALYRVAYGEARPRRKERLDFPALDWIGPRARSLETRTANDGIVPTASQWYGGPGNRKAIKADHLDVIGHFDGVGETFFKSGADMTRERFNELWMSIALALG